MANRRFSGNSPRSGRSFPQQFQNTNVSPWQGGAAPGNSLNSGLLSQLAAPQAQLALALTSLLQNQQQSNNPPSLLSLNTSPAFGSQDSYNSQNRFASRGRDFRRPDPYNKNRGGSGGGNWRLESRGNNKGSNRNDFRSNRDRRPQLKNKSSNKPKDSDKNEKVENDSSIKQSEEVVDVSLDESRDEDGTEKEKKRDWKEEKKAVGDKEEEAVDLIEDRSSPTAEDDKDKKKDQGMKRPREGRYQGVPPSLLHCFVCTKSMWDGESFQNHLRGKAHKQMMDSLIESFQITVNILRENMRLAEEKKMIELERFNRSSRNFHRKVQEPESHCNMCDLKFLGKIIAHRKTEGHQRLKRFLHPSCHHCNLEFPSRVEWVEHRFTREHLKKLADMDSGESAKIIEDDLEMDLEPLLEESLLSEDDNPVLELDDDLKDLQNRIPAYKKNRPVGTLSLKPLTGNFCEICDRFIHDKNVDAHLRSERHYYKFVDAAKTKYKAQTESKENDKEKDENNWKRRKLDSKEDNSEEKKEETETVNGDGNEMYDPEEACNKDNAANEDDEDEERQLDEEEENEGDIKQIIKEEPNTQEESSQQVPVKIKEESTDVLQKEVINECSVKVEKVENSPRVRRVGQVKNGAGPKSKTRGRK
ncbi:zinc finger protein on ecdysone puffs [Agrilus planipennis]|uniref:Zinc finger protein on ecdysone puffs n=1 Tax=Agrilus planipennis TaxID=224129 RepID=A0A1W4X8B3_AGRPL|nr:zinc finger protein on ecdysone puffs [Agrilus planipennis]XP_018328654.1 zinc finger protein on ecdysone puffs [Agrilus planipennis]